LDFYRDLASGFPEALSMPQNRISDLAHDADQEGKRGVPDKCGKAGGPGSIDPFHP
jgi:hypothetical protein